MVFEETWTSVATGTAASAGVAVRDFGLSLLIRGLIFSFEVPLLSIRPLSSSTVALPFSMVESSEESAELSMSQVGFLSLNQFKPQLAHFVGTYPLPLLLAAPDIVPTRPQQSESSS